MKLLLFAHTPPPLHGQSWMVQLMLEGFGGDQALRGSETGGSSGEGEPGFSPLPPGPSEERAETHGILCYHVNARLSADLGDVGRARGGKLGPLLRYCAQAWKYTLRFRPDAAYYVPSPPKRSSLYRDWVVMLLCRAFWRRTILHWHAVGLGEWLRTEARGWERWISHGLLDGADLAIVLGRFGEADARLFHPKRVAVVPNGIADPCPDYDRSLGLVRRERIHRRREAWKKYDSSGAIPITWVQVLYLAHCTRTKGLFDAIEGVRHANDQLSRQGTGIRLKLNVAGEFLEESERAEFQRILAAAGPGGWLQHWGFVQGAMKDELFREADLFCFPTFFPNEGHPVALLEAMAWGLVPVATRWRGIPELFAPDYAGLVEPRQPQEVARALISVLEVEGGQFRARFCESYLLDRHLMRLAQALREVSRETGS